MSISDLRNLPDKFLLTFGIGSATVDTVLDGNNYQPGTEITGTINIFGGNADQKVDKIQFYVMTKSENTIGEKLFSEAIKIQTVEIPINRTIRPEETLQMLFNFKLDERTPITSKKCPVWIRTELDVGNAIDPKDSDYINVIPHKDVQVIIDAFTELGFSIEKVKTQKVNVPFNGLPFMQEFVFTPTQGSKYKSNFNNICATFSLDRTGVELAMDIDRKVKGLTSLIAEFQDTNDISRRDKFLSKDLNLGVTFVSDALSQILDMYNEK